MSLAANNGMKITFKENLNSNFTCTFCYYSNLKINESELLFTATLGSTFSHIEQKRNYS